MKKTITTIVVLSLFAIGAIVSARSLTSSGEWKTIEPQGAQIHHKVPISNFTIIDLQAPVEVSITRGAKTECVITGHANLIECLNITTSASTFSVKAKDPQRQISSKSPVKIELTVTDGFLLNRINLESIAKLSVAQGLKATALSIDLSGGAELRLESLNVGALNLDASGVSKMWVNSLQTDKFDTDFSGGVELHLGVVNAKTMEIDGSGVGKVLIDHLSAGSVKSDLSGGLEIHVDAFTLSNLAIDASGVCKIKFGRGQADRVSADVSGGVDMAFKSLSSKSGTFDIGGVGKSYFGELNISNLSLDLSGGPQFTVESGKVTELLRIDGGGVAKVNMGGVTAQKVDYSLSGSCECTVRTSAGQASGSASGASRMNLLGSK